MKFLAIFFMIIQSALANDLEIQSFYGKLHSKNGDKENLIKPGHKVKFDEILQSEDHASFKTKFFEVAMGPGSQLKVI